MGVFYVLTNQISHYHVVEKFHYDMIISYARPPDGTLATINPFLPDNILNQNRYARTLRTHIHSTDWHPGRRSTNGHCGVSMGEVEETSYTAGRSAFFSHTENKVFSTEQRRQLREAVE